MFISLKTTFLQLDQAVGELGEMLTCALPTFLLVCTDTSHRLLFSVGGTLCVSYLVPEFSLKFEAAR